MSSVIYAIVFKGEIIEGAQLISVKAHMAKLLKVDVAKMAVLFSGKRVVIKKTTSKEEAIKYGTVLRKIGADVKVKVIKQDADTASAKPAIKTAAPPQQQRSVADAPQFDLKANEGNIFDPQPKKTAPALDMSGYSLAENDGSLLVEPRIVEKVNLDLSEYKVSENNGSPLVEPSPEVPKVVAPDFGLDEPGALLEMLKEEKELVNPDISGIVLAELGGDILSEGEKDDTPPPKAPDVSKMSLVPEFGP